MNEQFILQKRLIQFLVSDVFNTIHEEDILKQNSDGTWTHKGNNLLPATQKLLKKEAIAFSKTGLFAILRDEMMYHARKSLEKAQTENDIISAKLLSYFVDVWVSKIKKIAELPE